VAAGKGNGVKLRQDIDRCLVGYEQALTREVIADHFTQTPTKRLLRKETLDRIMEIIER